MTKQDKNNQIIIYNTEDGETKIEVKIKDKNFFELRNTLICYCEVKALFCA